MVLSGRAPNEMKSLISGYRHRPGEHCGSTALRNLLRHHCDLDLSESTTFGLGAGIDCIYLRSPEIDPEIVLFGRSATLERDLSEVLGLDYVEEPVADDEEAWRKVRGEILEGRPAVVCADTYYLDYRKHKVHFPFNRFVLVGFDDEQQKAYIHDRTHQEPQPVSYPALALARNPPEYPIHNLWGRFESTSVRRSVEEACPLALAKAARRMTGALATTDRELLAALGDERHRGAAGLEGLRLLREELPTWCERKELGWILSYASRTIEVFGTGGGNFRRLYAGFLDEARALAPDVVDAAWPAWARRSADLWTQLSQELNRIATEGDERGWKASVALVDGILATETELFQSIRARTDGYLRR